MRQLEALVALADCGHFGRAGERLGVTTAAISGLLVRLETTVGTPLVRRTSRRVALTAEGVALLEVARRALVAVAQVGERARAIAAARVGVIRIAALPGCRATAAGVAAALRRALPGWSVRVQVLDQRALTAAMRHRRVELAVVRRATVLLHGIRWTGVGPQRGGQLLLWWPGWRCRAVDRLIGRGNLLAAGGLTWPMPAIEWSTSPDEAARRREASYAPARARAPTQPIRSS